MTVRPALAAGMVAVLAVLGGCAGVPAAPDTPAAGGLPAGFVRITEAAPGVREEIRYFGSDNFLGRPVAGYLAPRCILSAPAAEALARAQREAATFGLGLKVFDCYRPQRAVQSFAAWARDPADTAAKARFYPEVDKSRLFAEGYIAERSGHSRGSTVDLTLVDAATGAELDMGTGFDLFSPLSWPDSPRMSAQQRANRMLLQSVMRLAGFEPYAQEWWHFTLEREPYPDTYFDFPVR